MPLPHFLILISVVIVAAGLTLFVTTMVGVPIGILAIFTLLAVAAIRLLGRAK